MQVSDLKVGDKFTFEYTVKCCHDAGVRCEASNGDILRFSKYERIHSRTYRASIPIKVGDIVRSAHLCQSQRYEVLGINGTLVWIRDLNTSQYHTDHLVDFTLDNS